MLSFKALNFSKVHQGSYLLCTVFVLYEFSYSVYFSVPVFTATLSNVMFTALFCT